MKKLTEQEIKRKKYTRYRYTARRMSELPTDINPVGRAIAQKIRTVREFRKLTPLQAAHSLGISRRVYEGLEIGKFVPSGWLQNRIVKWIYEGHSFWKNEYVDCMDDVAKGVKKRPYALRLPEQMAERARIASKRIGLSVGEFIAIAINRLLDNEPILKNFERYAKEITRARVIEIIQTNPAIQLILDAEKEMFAELEIEAPENPFPADIIMETPKKTDFKPTDVVGTSSEGISCEEVDEIEACWEEVG